MKEKILALLVAKFTGVRKDGLKVLASTMGLQCTTEEEAKALVEKVTDAQVNEFIKDYRADVDKEMSESNKTLETNLRKKFDFKEKVVKTEPGGEHDDPKPNDMAAMIKAAVAEAVKPFQEKLSGYEETNLAKTRLQALEDKLSACKNETFKEQTKKDFARMTFADDNAFNEYLNEKVADIEKANQNVADDKLSGAGGSPLFSQKSETGISQGVADFINSQKPEADSLGGKEL